MANNRIFYAVQAVGIGHSGVYPNSIGANSTDFEWMKGVQSVGITTNFNLEQVFELGQLGVYQNVDNVPEIEITLEKVIDGNKLLYLQCVGTTGKTNLVDASTKACNVYLAIYPDTNINSTGNGIQGLVFCSGMRLNNVSYNFSIDGNAKESVTLQGFDKYWLNPTGYSLPAVFGGNTPNAGALSPSGATVVRRQNVQFGAGKTVVPTTVAARIRDSTGNIQSIAIAADFKRDNIFELGAYRPYTKYTQFPIQITAEYQVISLSGDYVDASGYQPRITTADETIKVMASTDQSGNSTGVYLDLGTKNRLQSVNYTGGDTGGGNATTTYSYVTFNDFLVTDTGTYWTGS
jgi:hypothetical protein